MQSTGEGAQLWLCTVLRSLQHEMRAEPQYAQALGRYLPAAEAEAAAALWRCVQPLLQATLLTTTELDADALALLGAVRETLPLTLPLTLNLPLPLTLTLTLTRCATRGGSWHASASPCTWACSPSSRTGSCSRPRTGRPPPPLP